MTREVVYERQNGGTTRKTPRQRRRIVKKRRHMAARNDLFTRTMGAVRAWTE